MKQNLQELTENCLVGWPRSRTKLCLRLIIRRKKNLHIKDASFVLPFDKTDTERLIEAERAQQENVWLFVPRSSFASCLYTLYTMLKTETYFCEVLALMSIPSSQ